MLLLDKVDQCSSLDQVYSKILAELADLQGRMVAKVALKARGILVKKLLPSYEERLQEMDRSLRAAVEESDSDSDTLVMGKKGGKIMENFPLPKFERIRHVVETNMSMDDVLVPFFFNDDRGVSLASIECYVRRAYRAYILHTVKYHVPQSKNYPVLVEWDFNFPDVQGFEPEENGGKPVLRNNFSVSDFAAHTQFHPQKKEQQRVGVMAAFKSLAEVSHLLPVVPQPMLLSH